MAKALTAGFVTDAIIIEPTLELRGADAGSSAGSYGNLPEAPANAFLRGRDATHLYIQVQFMRSGRLSRLLSLFNFDGPVL